MDSLEGDYPLDGFGLESIARQRRGETEVRNDVLADPSQDAATWQAIDTRALASAPLIRDGRFRASLYANARTPRRWSAEEVALVEDVAGRTWASVERARAEAELRELNETLERRVEERTRERDRVWHLSRDMIGVADGQGVWHAANPAWSRVLGWAADRIVGRGSEWLSHGHLDPGMQVVTSRSTWGGWRSASGRSWAAKHSASRRRRGRPFRQGERVFDSALLVGPKGLVGTYRTGWPGLGGGIADLPEALQVEI